MSDQVNDPTSARPRYQRTTRLGDGCFTVSTVSTWLCCRRLQSAIFDERTGNARFVEDHTGAATREQLDAAHEDLCRRFAAGDIPLHPPPPFGPEWLGRAHDHAEWRLD